MSILPYSPTCLWEGYRVLVACVYIIQISFLDPSLTSLTAREQFGHLANREPAGLEFYEATMARLVTFAVYWHKSLTRSSYGKTNHND